MQPDAHRGVADAIPRPWLRCPGLSALPGTGPDPIQADDLMIKRVVRGDQIQPATEIELLLAGWRAAKEPDDDLWR